MNIHEIVIVRSCLPVRRFPVMVVRKWIKINDYNHLYCQHGLPW